MALVSFAAANPSTPAIPPYARLTQLLADTDEELASGNRFPPGVADPTLSTAQQLQTQLTTYRQGLQNGAGATSLLEMADTGLSQIDALFTTLRGLAVQASDTNITDAERGYLQAAFAQGFAQIDQIAGNTSFNGAQLLNGDASGADGGAAIPLALGDLPQGNINADIRSVTTARLFAGITPTLDNATDAAAAVTAVDNANALFQPVYGAVAGYQDRVAIAGQNLNAAIAGVEPGRAALVNTNIPASVRLFNELNDQQQTTLAVLAQARNLDSGLLNLLGARLNRALLQ